MLTAMVELTAERHPLLVNAISTGLTQYADGDMSKYQAAMKALPAATLAVQNLDKAGTTEPDLQKIAALQRALGFDQLVKELADDGRVNASTSSIAETGLLSVSQAAVASGALASVQDLNLRLCIADSLDKESAAVSNNDLQSLSRLVCNDAGVQSLNGISALSKLTYLHLEGNGLVDLSPLAALPTLSLLNVRNNRIASLKPLKFAGLKALAMMVAENCIGDPTELNESDHFTFSSYDTRAKRQFSTCLKDDAEPLAFVMRSKAKGERLLVFRSTYNPNAKCSIDWGDGSQQEALCDGRTYNLNHSYAATTGLRVKLMVNGEVKRDLLVPADPGTMPSPSWGLNFSSADVAAAGGTAIGSPSYIPGKDNGAAVSFAGGSKLKIPNRPEMKVGSGATFDIWVKSNATGAGTVLAKSHDRTGAALMIAGTAAGVTTAGVATFDLSWACPTKNSLRGEPIEPIPYGSWFRLTVVIDPNNGYRAYLNKKLSSGCGDIKPNILVMDGQDSYIGGFSDYWWPLTGAVQDLKIYNSALTEEQVQALP